MLERVPERARTPAVARAITAPSTLLLAGAGMSVAILGGLPVVAAAAVGAVVWVGKVALAIPRRPRAERIDMSRLGDPWRRYVQDAMLAQIRFQQAVKQTRPGPLRDHLTEVDARIGAAVRECWHVARQGQDLDVAMATIDVMHIHQELAQCQAERPSPALERTVQALQSQLASAQRIEAVEATAKERLRLLNAQLDEAVAEAVELSVKGSDVGSLHSLTASVESMVDELTALRHGLEEMGGGTTPLATP
jgi:hypothetical protein